MKLGVFLGGVVIQKIKSPPPSLRGFYKMFDKSRHLGPFTLFGNLMSLPLMINTLARLFALMDQTCRRRYFVVEGTQLLTLYCFELLQMAPPAIQTQDVVFAYSLVCIFAGCRCWSICITLYHSMFWWSILCWFVAVSPCQTGLWFLLEQQARYYHNRSKSWTPVVVTI